MADEPKTRIEIIAEGFGLTVEEATAREAAHQALKQQKLQERMARAEAMAKTDAAEATEAAKTPKKLKSANAVVADDPKA